MFVSPSRTLIAAVLLIATCSAPGPVNPAGGWSWKLPPNLVVPDSGKRNNVFYVGQPVRFALNGGHADRYEVRDYYGRLVARGAAAPVIAPKVNQPGWYKLYLYGRPQGEPWGSSVGSTTFCVFRRKPGFPPLPPKGASGGTEGDEVMRGVTGMGPQRHAVPDASKPDEAIRKLEENISIDRQYYLPYDPYRQRALMVAFPNGTKDLAGVRKIVEHFRGVVKYWEPRNEPNFGSSGAQFVTNEMKPFYETVKSVDPALKVLGPGAVTVGPALLAWTEDFLRAGGARYIDGFSFHAYNNVNGDLWLARKSMDTLQALLAKYGADKLEKWQTEQGYMAAVYGAYQPRLQGRWTMLQMMVFEQYGIPKEHNHLWYDVSHGFWDMPTWWENEDGGLNPAAALMRVWSEELYGTRFARRYSFGNPGDRLYVGSLFSGPGKRVAAFMSAGSTDGRVVLRAHGATKLHLVSAFGVESTLKVQGGRATLAVPELPVYVELAKGQTIDVVPTDWGPDLALMPGTKALASGSGKHPGDPTISNPTSKIINGELENWYWLQQKDAQPWMDDTPGFPAWVEVRLPKPRTVSRVVVYACPPWQWVGSLLSYELQIERDGCWVTVDRVNEPTNTFRFFSPPTRTTVDSFYSDRWVFQHHLRRPVTTQAIRLLVHDTTYGGGATKAVADAGGQTGFHHVALREVELYPR